MDPRIAYREVIARSNSPVRLVVLLYEQVIEDLRRALAALEGGDVERRTQEIGHALVVVGQLQGTLDMARGGEVAQQLERFYDLLRARLLEAQLKGSAEILRRQIANLLSLREAWTEVERATMTEPASAQSPAISANNATPDFPRQALLVDWKV